VGRVPMLWLGLAASLSSLAINKGFDTIEGMWYAIIPVALLNQNFSCMKALFSDYIDELGGTDADRAGAVGKLGMAVGLSFMAGPLLATLLVSNYQDSLYLSAAITLLSAALLVALPRPAAKESAPTGEKAPESSGLMNFLSIPVLKTRGAQLLVSIRLLMALAFHMFAPIWQVSIKNRFDFGPADHAKFMGLIGLTYALSQGLVAKPLVKLFGHDPTRLLLLCILLLGGSRPFALLTSSIYVVYALYIPMVISLGVMNTAITTAASNLADGSQLGGFFGFLESVESSAGIIGPTLGGLLSKASYEHATLAAVCAAYACAFVLVFLFFGTHVVSPAKAKEQAAAKQAVLKVE